MKWNGKKELVIGECVDGKVVTEYRVFPGEEIPPDAMRLIKEADSPILDVPYDALGHYDKRLVEAAIKIK